MNDKPNCYECQYRRSIPGDCHSKCVHPVIADLHNNPAAEFMTLLGKRSGFKHPISADAMGIQGKKWGIDHGWFIWPFNFDPVWLLTCDGFEAKEQA